MPMGFHRVGPGQASSRRAGKLRRWLLCHDFLGVLSICMQVYQPAVGLLGQRLAALQLHVCSRRPRFLRPPAGLCLLAVSGRNV